MLLQQDVRHNELFAWNNRPSSSESVCPRHPARSTAPAARPLRLRGCRSLAEPRAGQRTSRPVAPAVPRRPPSGEPATRPAVRRAEGTARRLWRPMPSWAAPASFPVSNILPLERS